MPRTAGLSGSSRVWFILRKPSDSTVARIAGLAPIGDFTSVALIFWAPGAPPACVFSATRGASGAGRLRLDRCRRAYRLSPLVRGGQALADHLVDATSAQLRDLRRRLQH